MGALDGCGRPASRAVPAAPDCGLSRLPELDGGCGPAPRAVPAAPDHDALKLRELDGRGRPAHRAVLQLSRTACWMEDAFVRGRLRNSPGHWGRNLIRDPPTAGELSNDFEQPFPDGRPFEFARVACV